MERRTPRLRPRFGNHGPRSPWTHIVVALASMAGARTAAAQDPPTTPNAGTATNPPPGGPDRTDYTTARYEPAGLPIVGGNSDIGVLLGGALTLSRFADGVRPYRWNMDVTLSGAVKSGPSGPEITQYNLAWDLDLPSLLGGVLRLQPALNLQRAINAGYFGLGNVSNGVTPATATSVPGRYFESLMTTVGATVTGRYALVGHHLSSVAVLGYRYVAADAYAGSQLAIDGARTNPGGTPYIWGLRDLSLAELTLGMIYDSRDSEIVPTRGTLQQYSVHVLQGIPSGAEVRYVEVGVNVAGYLPIAGPLWLAARFVGDLQVGNVPFYDLLQGGPFNPNPMVGGESGVRGVPFGRYMGPLKFVANLELRMWLFGFHLGSQRFRVGSNFFFDTGRIWSDITFHNPLDGTGIGLKYGTGAGVFIRWGQAAVIRIEAAYSPDAVAENPGFPFGIYVSDGVMF